MRKFIDEASGAFRRLSAKAGDKAGALDQFVASRIPMAPGRIGETTSHSTLGGQSSDGEAAMAGRAGPELTIWTDRLVIFLRAMAVLALLKGLFHWSRVTGIFTGAEFAFDAQPLPYQTATVYFAVIELVAAVGLWLATPWGAVVWLTAIVSMAVVELMFPAIYGGGLVVIGLELLLLAAYLVLAFLSAHERPA